MIKKIVAIIALVGAGLSCAHAKEQFNVGKTLKTQAGVVTVRPGSKAECKRLQNFDTCQLLEVAGQPLISEYQMWIDAAIPSKSNPSVIFATASTGGNACCTNYYLIDLTGSQPKVVEVPALPQPYEHEAVVTTFDGGFTYENFGEDSGPLGEPLWKVYRYRYGGGKVDVLRSVPKYSFTAIDKKKYPSEIFNDPIYREPIIKATGRSGFLELRSRMGAQLEIKREDGNFYVGKGCLPHSCTIEEGIFVLDAARKKAWALYFTSDRRGAAGKFFGTLETTDIMPRKIFEKWLKQHEMSWSQVVIDQENAVTRKTVAGAIGRASIPLTRESGIYKVPVTINGIIPVAFILDSGASDVVIPADIVAIMMKTGTLSSSDFTGTKTYKLANGSTVPSNTFRIRSLRVGDKVLENVDATMTGVDGVLLLGQSFLGKFQRWSINNSNHTLELE